MNKVFGFKTFLVLGWFLMQIVLFQHYGVKVVFDSHRFIRFTTEILTHQPITDIHVWRYLGYPLFMAPFFYVDAGLKWVVLAQMAISGLAAICLYKATLNIAGKDWHAIIATSLFIFNPDLQAWNCYILTDSLFISLFTICLCLVLLPKSRLNTSLLVTTLIGAILVRPNGFIAIFTIAAYYGFKYNPFSRYNRWMVGGIIAVLLVGFYFILDFFILKTFTLMIPYRRGDLIYGYYEIVLNKYYQPEFPPPSPTPLLQLLWFIFKNPFYFLAMAFLKGFFFFAHIKPFYSTAHNIGILVYLLPVYFLAFKGWLHQKLLKPIKALFLTPIFLQASITMLTIEDWDGRWLYPILPPILILAVLGLDRLKLKGGEK